MSFKCGVEACACRAELSAYPSNNHRVRLAVGSGTLPDTLAVVGLGWFGGQPSCAAPVSSKGRNDLGRQ